MIRYFFALFLLVASLCATAQYEVIKNSTILPGHLKKAKEDLDKGMANAKFAAKAEAHILKALIYAKLATDEEISKTPEAIKFRDEAAAAFAKYKEMEPELTLIKDPVYMDAPIKLYSAFFAAGYKDYESKNWEHGYEMYSKAIEFADLMIKEKLFAVPIDTSGVLLAAVMAENSKRKDDAAKYYTRLADFKIGGPDYEGIYRFLVTYYFNKKDMDAFEKYKAYGKELYPKSDFFTYDKVDFAVGQEGDLNFKIATLDEILAKTPDDPKANQSLGEVIYDALNPRKEETPLPPNAEELEKRMVIAFNKSAKLEPNSELPYLFLGDHFISKSIKINDAREAHVKDMKARTKPGTMASKEDLQKRDLLDKQYGETLEQAREPYEKAAPIFAAKTKLELQDKQHYKKVASYLADIYAYKRTQAKGKPADIAKFTAEEKKWNGVYESIK
jgi:hypothetical protein